MSTIHFREHTAEGVVPPSVQTPTDCERARKEEKFTQHVSGKAIACVCNSLCLYLGSRKTSSCCMAAGARSWRAPNIYRSTLVRCQLGGRPRTGASCRHDRCAVPHHTSAVSSPLGNPRGNCSDLLIRRRLSLRSSAYSRSHCTLRKHDGRARACRYPLQRQLLLQTRGGNDASL